MSHAPRFLGALVALVAAGVLSACGLNYQTNQQYQAGVGADHREGDVQILAAVLVDNGDGTATLSGRLLNDTADVQQLTDISATTLDGRGLTVGAGEVRLDLPAGNSVAVGTEHSLIVTVDGVQPGDYATLTFEFSNSKSVVLNVPVDNRTDMYESVPTADADDEAAAENY